MASNKSQIKLKIYQMQEKIIKSNFVAQNDISEINFSKYLHWKIKFHDHSRQRKGRSDQCFGYIALFSIIPIIIMIGISHLINVRCLLPNNYMVWESTRPISDCKFCRGVQRPIILPNITREQFLKYAYLGQPIIVKNAASDWPARERLTFQYIKSLYNSNPDILESFNDECQFLPFKSNFASLKDFLEMPEPQEKSGNPSYYVGFSNCQQNILAELRKLYPIPHFLPIDAEIPNTDYIFLGYNEGAVMHLDYIPRLMWQAQLQGNKSWLLTPPPECDSKCEIFSFYVEPGDIVVLDTRIWYHETSVAENQFSMTIQSEYG